MPTSSHTRMHQLLIVRLTLMISAVAMVAVLLHLRLEPPVAVATALATVLGGAEVSCRLTLPVIAPRVRITVIVVITSVVTTMLYGGVDPVVAVAVVLAVAASTVELARRAVEPAAHHLAA